MSRTTNPCTRPPCTRHSPLVSLVGAGPGDPGLLTLRAVECLAEADLVLYDRLVPARLLEHAPAAARRVCVDELPGCHPERWPHIHQAMIDAARQGLRVVRLKGGDPFIFGRGGEEAEALRQAGIAYEIVPGVTAALAAAACAGIPADPPRSRQRRRLRHRPRAARQADGPLSTGRPWPASPARWSSTWASPGLPRSRPRCCGTASRPTRRPPSSSGPRPAASAPSRRRSASLPAAVDGRRADGTGPDRSSARWSALRRSWPGSKPGRCSASASW